MSFDTATPYIASYVILKKNNKVAFILRSHTDWMDGHYGLAAGKVEKGETFAQAAIREAKEEAGVDINITDLKPAMTMHRKEPDGMEWVDVFFEVTKWSGKAHNAEPAMHSKLEWLDTTHLPDNIIPSISYVLDQIAHGKTYCEYGWGI